MVSSSGHVLIVAGSGTSAALRKKLSTNWAESSTNWSQPSFFAVVGSVVFHFWQHTGRGRNGP